MSDDHEEKVAGRRGRNIARFDPNAVDADGDGLIQDSTPFQRPATPGVRRTRLAPLSEMKPKRLPAGTRVSIDRNVGSSRSTYAMGVVEGPDPDDPNKHIVRIEKERRNLNDWVDVKPRTEKIDTFMLWQRVGSGDILPKRPVDKPSQAGPDGSVAFYANIPGATDKAKAVLAAIDKNAKKTKFDAAREFDDYEKKFPKHTADGMMGKDSADLPKMRELMKKLIDEATDANVQYAPLRKMSDDDLESFWSILNGMPSPATRAQFLAMMLADFELGLRKLARDRAKKGPAPYEDATKVQKIVDNLKKRNLL